jgi:hypothetical protein
MVSDNIVGSKIPAYVSHHKITTSCVTNSFENSNIIIEPNRRIVIAMVMAMGRRLWNKTNVIRCNQVIREKNHLPRKNEVVSRNFKKSLGNKNKRTEDRTGHDFAWASDRLMLKGLTR